MRIGLAQIRPRLGDIEQNVQMHLEMIRRAREEQVDLLVFPELSLTGYNLLDLTYDVARTADSDEIQKLVAEADPLDLVFGFVETSKDHILYNSALYASNRQIKHVHRKVYLPTYGLFDEGRYFGSGNVLRAFDTRFGRIGVLICEDMCHPSTSYLLAQDGAQIILAMANSPTRGLSSEGFSNRDYWYTTLKSTAMSYGVFVCFAQRIGSEDGLSFCGGSMVFDPFGKQIAQAPLFEENLLLVDIDLDQVRKARYEMPILRDEKIELTIRELKRILKERTKVEE
jgi:predicted amidohydrolase